MTTPVERAQPWVAPVLAVCGWSGSGKTTLLEAVIPSLTAAGLTVAVVKHDAHGIDVDRPGKDSDRLFRTGATVLVRSPAEAFARTHPGPHTELLPVLGELALSHDLILVEGHKDTPLPKLWLEARDDRAIPDTVENVLERLPWDSDRARVLRNLIDRRVAEHHGQRPLFAGVLLGGASSRMGRAKHLLELGGRTFLERVTEAVSTCIDSVLLLGAGELPDTCSQLLRLPDPPGLAGPLAGLLAAQRWAPECAWLVVACDLPLIDRDAIEWIVEQRGPGRWAVMPRAAGGRLEPLAAVYEPQSRPLLERLAAVGGAAPRRLADHAKTATPDAPARVQATLRNFNTPEDLESLDTALSP